ncbi:MAG: efflux RND transporter periplasmic adaptor subunit [Deferrisomatales bacterium]|nr:efflux RND transporter periplasmic adaptor subunit [Deferrisomatales bacterium]
MTRSGLHLLILSLLCTACLVAPRVGLAAPEGPGGPPPTVVVDTVTETDVVPASEYVGHVEAIQAVDLYAQVVGTIQQVHFEEGQLVKEGVLLFTIEPASYQAKVDAAAAALAQARASREGAQADLDAARSAVEAAAADRNAAEAAADLADKYLARMRSVDKRSIVQADLETAESKLLQAQARVAQAVALIHQRESQVLQGQAQLTLGDARILQAQADLDLARIQRGYTEIRSPITGVIGKAASTRGNYVGPATGPLARIVQMEPIRVVYSISENDVIAVQQAQTAAGAPQTRLLAPRLRMADGRLFAGSGQVSFVDNQVDPATGTIAVRARFQNPERLLIPGQYVTVLVKASAPRLMPVVPQAAVLVNQDGRYVLTVDGEGRAVSRPITVGPAVGTGWAVESGVSVGEQIIVGGIQKVRPGQPVSPTPAQSQGR